MKKNIALWIVALVSALSISSQAQNLLSNPGFESPVLTGSPAGTTGNWIAFAGGGGGAAAFANLGTTTPHAPSLQNLQLGFTNMGGGGSFAFTGAFQYITGLLPNQQLTISGFVQSSNPDFNLNQTRLRFEWRNSADGVAAGSTDTQTPNFGTVGSPSITSTYIPFSYNITVPNNVNITSARVVIAMNAAGGTTNGTVNFDDMTLTVVPEPAAAALAGFGGLSLLLRRRSRRSA